jgi:hypothetical protein
VGLLRVLAGCRGSAGRLRRRRCSKVRLWWDKFGWSESARGVALAARRLLKMRAQRRLGVMRKESAVWGVLSCATWVEKGAGCRYGADRRYRRGEAQGWAVPGSGVV